MYTGLKYIYVHDKILRLLHVYEYKFGIKICQGSLGNLT